MVKQVISPPHPPNVDKTASYSRWMLVFSELIQVHVSFCV